MACCEVIVIVTGCYFKEAGDGECTLPSELPDERAYCTEVVADSLVGNDKQRTTGRRKCNR